MSWDFVICADGCCLLSPAASFSLFSLFSFVLSSKRVVRERKTSNEKKKKIKITRDPLRRTLLAWLHHLPPVSSHRVIRTLSIADIFFLLVIFSIFIYSDRFFFFCEIFVACGKIECDKVRVIFILYACSFLLLNWFNISSVHILFDVQTIVLENWYIDW